MADIVPRRDLPSVAMGRPSQNLGHPFHAQLDHNVNLPVNIFESNPLTLNRGLENAVNRTVNAQGNGGARGLLETIQDRLRGGVRPPTQIGPPVPSGLPTAVSTPLPKPSGPFGATSTFVSPIAGGSISSAGPVSSAEHFAIGMGTGHTAQSGRIVGYRRG